MHYVLISYSGTQPQQLVLVPVEPNMNMNMPPLINCNAVSSNSVVWHNAPIMEALVNKLNCY